MKRKLNYLLALSLTSSLPLYGLSQADRTEVLDTVERIVEQQKAVEKEIDKLKRLLGVYSELEGLPLLQPQAGMSERVKVRIEDGIKAYNDKKFEQAKEAFQTAWEEDPNNYIVNFNLGMAYHRLGNLPLAKRMLKAAVDIKPKMENASKINEYLTGKGTKVAEVEEEEEGHTKFLRTELTNLQKEVDSYMHSDSISAPKRRASVAKVLAKMIEKASDNEEMVKKYFVNIADSYTDLELYDDALATFKQYEKNMEGEVLPDGYHAKVLKVQEQQDTVNRTLAAYLGNVPARNVRRAIERDQEELVIFATQMNEFVSAPNKEDEDFSKICQRLKEYRWGNRPGRHVLVINRYEELLYSSLDGTLPLARYQDTKGQQFLRNVAKLGKRLSEKEAGYVEVDLWLKDEAVTYSVLFSYVPKHEAYIVVRYPKRDIN